MKPKSIVLAFIAATVGSVLLSSCSQDDMSGGQSNSATARTDEPGGVASEIPAYYDGKLFQIKFMQFSDKAAATLIAHNHNIDEVYQSDPGLPGGQPFVSVITGLPGDGGNEALWREVQITFNEGHTPRQFFSDDEINDAVNAGEITLTWTDEVYKCPVHGPKN